MPLTSLRLYCFLARQSHHHSVLSTPGRTRWWLPNVDKDRVTDSESKQQLPQLSFAQDVKNQLVYLDEAVEGNLVGLKYTGRNAADMMQICYQVESSENQTCYNLIFADLLQVVETTCIKLVDKKS